MDDGALCAALSVEVVTPASQQQQQLELLMYVVAPTQFPAPPLPPPSTTRCFKAVIQLFALRC